MVEMYNPNIMVSELCSQQLNQEVKDRRILAQQFGGKKSSATEKIKELFFKHNAPYPYSYTADFPLMVNHTVVKNITEVAVSDSEKNEVAVPDWSPGITVNGTKLCTCTKTKPASNDCALIPKEHVSENLRRLVGEA